MQIDPFIKRVIDKRRASARNAGRLSEPANPLEWAERYRRPEDQPFSLARYEPLRAIYMDDHPRVCICKPAQRGASEWALNVACYALEFGAKRWVPDGSKNGLNVLVVFPVHADLIDFAKERIEGLKGESIHLATMFSSGDWDALGFKQVGNSNLFLRGGQSKTGLKSFSADVLILDEYDELNPEAVFLARKRMNASVVKREIAISTPTFPGRGIHAEYLASDQRVYESCCPHCGEWRSLDFFRDVRVDGESYETWKHWTQDRAARSEPVLHCPSCAHRFTDDERCAPGRWVAQQPEVTRTRGYMLPWWPWRFVDLAALVHSALSPNPSELQELYRSDLGVPYGAGGGSITEDMLYQLAVECPVLPEKAAWRHTTLGADIGARIHYWIESIGPDGQIYVRDQGSVAGWMELDRLMLRYQVRMAVVDAEPEILTAEEFCLRWRGRAMRAFYPSNATALQGRLYNVKPRTHDVQVNRTMALDAVLAAVAAGRDRWPASVAHDPEVVAHFTAPTRVKVESDTGQQRYSWVHTLPDHLMHAKAYCMIARHVLPKTSAFEPAVGGDRPLLHAYEQLVRQGAAPGSATVTGAALDPLDLAQRYASEKPIFNR